MSSAAASRRSIRAGSDTSVPRAASRRRLISALVRVNWVARSCSPALLVCASASRVPSESCSLRRAAVAAVRWATSAASACAPASSCRSRSRPAVSAASERPPLRPRCSASSRSPSRTCSSNATRALAAVSCALAASCSVTSVTMSAMRSAGAGCSRLPQTGQAWPPSSRPASSAAIPANRRSRRSCTLAVVS